MTGSPEDGDLVASAPMVEVPKEVLKAVRTLIAWAGDDPAREGLLDTPARVARAWKEYARGYAEDPAAHLARTFEEVGGYDEIVLLKDIPFQSALRASSRADHRQGGDRLFAAATEWSESPSLPGCCTVMRGDCRCRSG